MCCGSGIVNCSAGQGWGVAQRRWLGCLHTAWSISRMTALLCSDRCCCQEVGAAQRRCKFRARVWNAAAAAAGSGMRMGMLMVVGRWAMDAPAAGRPDLISGTSSHRHTSAAAALACSSPAPAARQFAVAAFGQRSQPQPSSQPCVCVQLDAGLYLGRATKHFWHWQLLAVSRSLTRKSLSAVYTGRFDVIQLTGLRPHDVLKYKEERK